MLVRTSSPRGPASSTALEYRIAYFIKEFGDMRMVTDYAAIADDILTDRHVVGRFEKMMTATQIAINMSAPLYELGYRNLQDLKKEKILNTDPKDIVDYLHRDTASAEEARQQFARLFSILDHNMAMMTSNYNLYAFLREQKISSNEINEIQAELREYWKTTYGRMLDAFWEIKEALGDAMKLLKQEIELHQRIERDVYEDWFKDVQKLTELFLEERRIFYDRIVKGFFSITETIPHAQAWVKSQKIKLQTAMHAFIIVANQHYEQEVEQARSILGRSAIQMMYGLTFLMMVYGAKKTVVKEGTSYGIGKVVTKIKVYFTIRHEKEYGYARRAIGDAIQDLSNAKKGIKMFSDAIEGL
jgi:hypothetical protein